MQKFLNPRNDVAFKRLFGTEKNKDILITLLNEVLKNQLHRKIVDVLFLSPIQEPEILSKKQSIVDVLCKDKDGCQYIIEMQVANTTGFEERAQYYASKAFSTQMNRGEDYRNLKEVIFLAFTNFSIFPDKEEYKSEHVTLDKKTYANDLKKLSFTFVDLVKFEKQCPSDLTKLNLEEKFYYFLRHAEDINPRDLSTLMSGDKVIKKAFEELNKVFWTEEELRRYDSDEKAQRDNKAAMDYAVNKGREEGREEGEKKGILKTAKKMLKKGSDISFIKECTGLSEEEISKLS